MKAGKHACGMDIPLLKVCMCYMLSLAVNDANNFHGKLVVKVRKNNNFFVWHFCNFRFLDLV